MRGDREQAPIQAAKMTPTPERMSRSAVRCVCMFMVIRVFLTHEFDAKINCTYILYIVA